MKGVIFYPDGTSNEFEYDNFEILGGSMNGCDIGISFTKFNEEKVEFPVVPVPSKVGVVKDENDFQVSIADYPAVFERLVETRHLKKVKFSKSTQFSQKNKRIIEVGPYVDFLEAVAPTTQAIEDLVNREKELGSPLHQIQEVKVHYRQKEKAYFLIEEVAIGYQPKV